MCQSSCSESVWELASSPLPRMATESRVPSIGGSKVGTPKRRVRRVVCMCQRSCFFVWDAKSSISTTCGTGLPILVGIRLKCLTQRYNFELSYVSFPHSQVGIFREAPHTPLNSDTEQVSGRRPKVEATAKKRHQHLAWELACNAAAWDSERYSWAWNTSPQWRGCCCFG